MASDRFRSATALAVADLPPSYPQSPRRLLLRNFCQKTTWAQANQVFHSEAHRVLEIARRLPRHLLRRKVPTPPLGGADDVSRDWSIRAFLADFARALSEDGGDPGCTLTYPHSAHGELTAHGWLCLTAIHQQAHRRQAERIASTPS